MANRSIRELLNLAVVDYRFYMGTIRDFSSNGNDGVWGAVAPTFRRDIGGVVGLDFDGVSTQIVTTPAISYSDEYAYEIVFYARSDGGGAAGRFIEPPTGNCDLRWNGNNMRWDSGVVVNTLNAPPNISHFICSRDNADNGHTYLNSVHQVTGANGNQNVAAEAVRIGNTGGLNRTFDGLFYSVRIFNDHIDADEAARLYEHSRIQLWPGASKRSGIMSVAE